MCYCFNACSLQKHASTPLSCSQQSTLLPIFIMSILICLNRSLQYTQRWDTKRDGYIFKFSLTYDWGAFSEKTNFGFFERVLWKGKFWPKFSQNLPLQPKFAFSQNHWNMPKNWNLCPFRHSINFLDESHCKGTEELIQKNNWSHKKFSYFITERVKDSSF